MAQKEADVRIKLAATVCQKPTTQFRAQIKVLNWHFSSNRQATTCLHRLRSEHTEHTHLNAFRHRIDQEADPSCRRDCKALENIQHVLLDSRYIRYIVLDCSRLEWHRRKIKTFFSTNNICLNQAQLILGRRD